MGVFSQKERGIMCAFFQKERGIPALAPLAPSFCPASCGIPQAIILPIQFPSDTPVVSSRVLYDARRTHNTFRDEDSL